MLYTFSLNRYNIVGRSFIAVVDVLQMHGSLMEI